jgi:hypothetical protein
LFASHAFACLALSAAIQSDVDIVFTDLGSVVSYAGEPLPLAVTGDIGAGALVVFLVTGSLAIFASSLPISFACKIGAKRAIR